LDTGTSWFVNQVLFRVYPVSERDASVGLRDEITCFWSMCSCYVNAFQVILPGPIRPFPLTIH